MMPKREVDLSRLAQAMRKGRLVLKRFREERMDAVKQFTGQHWGTEYAGTPPERTPVNLLGLYISVIGRSLIAKNPRVMLSTFNRKMKPLVSAMEAWANQEVEDTNLAAVLQRVVLDALFCLGIAKVALASPAEAGSYAWNLKAGKPFVARVDLDDFVFDTHARDFGEVSFIGHRYRVPLELVQESGLYSAARKELTASDDSPYNQEGDERVGTLGRGVFAGSEEEFEEHVDLWEVYIPRRRLILTLADDQILGASTDSRMKPLREQEWLGPDHGPYHVLSLGTVPGNAMPKGPVTDLIDLHGLVNRLYRKLGRQGERQKEVLGVAGGMMEDGSRVQQASDGDIIRQDRPEAMKLMSFGGPNQQNLLFATHLKDLFAYLAGNLDMMGGLSPQSKTLGQDQLLAQNATKAVADMQDATLTFTGKAIEALCWYWYHDPHTTMRSKYDLPGLPGMSIERRVTPVQRMQARFADLAVKTDPYSMQHSTPQSRAQALTQLVQNIVIPMMPLLQQQGIMFDLNVFLEKLARYLDMPDLSEVLTTQAPPVNEPAQGQAQPGQPGETTRNYVRRSLGGESQQAGENDLMNQLMAAGASQNGNGQG